MANDIDIKVGVLGSNDILKLTKDLDKTEDNVKKLSIAFKENRITNQALLVGLNQQVKAVKELGVSHTVAKSKVFGLYNEMKQLSVEQLRLQTASGKGMRRFEVLAQQAGYQFGDLAVQIQGGTNAAVALGQQGSQLLGFFGPAGALAGAGLAITTAFIAPLIKAKEKVNELEEQVEKSLENIENEFRATKLGVSTQELVYLDTLAAKQVEYAEAQSSFNTLRKTFNEAGMLDEASRASLEDEAEVVRQLGAELSEASAKYQDFLSARTAIRSGGAGDLSAFGGEGDPRYSPEAIEKAKKLAEEEAQARLDAALTFFDQYEEGWKIAGTQIIEDQKKQAEEAAAHAKAVFENTVFRATLRFSAEYDVDMINSGLISGALGDIDSAISSWKNRNKKKSSAKSPAERLEDYLKKQENLVKLQTRQVGLSEEQARVEELKNKYTEAGLEPNMQRINDLAAEEEQLRKLTEAEQKRMSMMDTIEGHIEDAFMTMIDGSASVTDAFKGMLRNILLEIYKQQVAEPIATSAGNFLREFLPKLKAADGAAFSNGKVTPFAAGGVVSSPTLFPMANGAGLMGEAGPEAIMPLKRGPNGKLGVEASGGQQVVVNQSFNFAANGDESVKKIIAQAAPQIAQMTQKQIVDSRRRGGQMKAAFS